MLHRGFTETKALNLKKNIKYNFKINSNFYDCLLNK